MDVSRRKFIQGTATGAAGAALAGGALLGSERADAATLNDPALAEWPRYRGRVDDRYGVASRRPASAPGVLSASTVL